MGKISKLKVVMGRDMLDGFIEATELIFDELNIKMKARIAQSVEHWSNKPAVAGSIPASSIFFDRIWNQLVFYNMII